MKRSEMRDLIYRQKKRIEFLEHEVTVLKQVIERYEEITKPRVTVRERMPYSDLLTKALMQTTAIVPMDVKNTQSGAKEE